MGHGAKFLRSEVEDFILNKDSIEQNEAVWKRKGSLTGEENRSESGFRTSEKLLI